jgi:hypothetical protein
MNQRGEGSVSDVFRFEIALHQHLEQRLGARTLEHGKGIGSAIFTAKKENIILVKRRVACAAEPGVGPAGQAHTDESCPRYPPPHKSGYSRMGVTRGHELPYSH